MDSSSSSYSPSHTPSTHVAAASDGETAPDVTGQVRASNDKDLEINASRSDGRLLSTPAHTTQGSKRIFTLEEYRSMRKNMHGSSVESEPFSDILPPTQIDGSPEPNRAKQLRGQEMPTAQIKPVKYLKDSKYAYTTVLDPDKVTAPRPPSKKQGPFPRLMQQFDSNQRIKLQRDSMDKIIPGLVQLYLLLQSGLELTHTVHGSLLPHGPAYTDESRSNSNRPRIQLWPVDTLSAAWTLRLEDKEVNMAILSFADEYKPGGEIFKGSTRQEENLCIRSTLMYSLKQEFYPLRDDTMIWSPNVLVLRDSDLEDLSLEERHFLHVISCAAEKRSNRGSAYEDVAQALNMEDRFKHILRLAAAKECKKIVLGPLGCGVYGHPAEDVAQILQRILISPAGAEEDWYAAGIEEIIIAVRDFSDNDNCWPIWRDSFSKFPTHVDVDETGELCLDRWMKTF